MRFKGTQITDPLQIGHADLNDSVDRRLEVDQTP